MATKKKPKKSYLYNFLFTHLMCNALAKPQLMGNKSQLMISDGAFLF